MTPPQLYTQVVVLHDFPEFNLKAGDTAVYVEPLPSTQYEDGAILEVFNALGESMTIATVPLSAIAPLTADDRPTVRRVSA